MIRFEQVSFFYRPEQAALQSITLQIEEYTSTALIGANGSGKTTLLNLLTGLYRYQGTILYRNRNLREISPDIWRSKIGVMFQNPDHQLFMPTVYDEMNLSLNQTDNPSEEAILLTLDYFGIGALMHRRPDQLSMGEKKKVVLAAIMIRKPELLILDEPTAHLDLRGIRELADLVNQLPLTKILATHDYHFAARCCSHGIVLHKGCILAQGNLPDILADSVLLSRADISP